MIRFVITGDTHGEYARLNEIRNIMEKYGDNEKYLCVSGDFGYLFIDDYYEHRILNEIEKEDYTIIVIPGNHENYNAFKKYDLVNFHGAMAYRVRKNIFYIKRGEIFEIGGKSFFCMSGGNSVDKYMRVENATWWKDEMPTDDEYRYAAENLAEYRKSGKRIDYVISHTAPLSGLHFLGKTHGESEKPLNNFLEYVRELLRDECIMHYYGHLHMDKEMEAIRQRVLWFDYVEIELEGNEE